MKDSLVTAVRMQRNGFIQLNKSDLMTQLFNNAIHTVLTHWGLVKPYGDIDLS